MNKLVTFSLIGKNNINTIPQIFEHLYSNRINIQKSQLINMSDSFILHADAETRHKVCINNLLDRYSNFIDINPNKIYYNSTVSNKKLIIKNSDGPGIIHNTSKILIENFITIDKMESYITSAPISGNNIFNLNAYFYYPNNSKLLDDQLYDKLNNLGYDYQIVENI